MGTTISVVLRFARRSSGPSAPRTPTTVKGTSEHGAVCPIGGRRRRKARRTTVSPTRATVTTAERLHIPKITGHWSRPSPAPAEIPGPTPSRRGRASCCRANQLRHRTFDDRYRELHARRLAGPELATSPSVRAHARREQANSPRGDRRPASPRSGGSRPRLLIRDTTSSRAPDPMGTTMITAATPIMMPSVRQDAAGRIGPQRLESATQGVEIGHAASNVGRGGGRRSIPMADPSLSTAPSRRRTPVGMRGNAGIVRHQNDGAAIS